MLVRYRVHQGRQGPIQVRVWDRRHTRWEVVPRTLYIYMACVQRGVGERCQRVEELALFLEEEGRERYDR